MKTTTTTDKVQVGDSTTGTSTSTTWKISSPPTEYGWACPRCGRINAPWKSSCDCSGNYWYPIWSNPSVPNTPVWWKDYVTCQGADATTNKATTTWSAVNSAIDTGGSDYWNSVTRNWENVPHTLTNMQKELDEIKSTFSNTLRGE